MSTKAIQRSGDLLPAIFDDFFKPWNEWFTNGNAGTRMLTMPAVNVSETADEYQISVAAPGLKKEDFQVDVKGNMLTVSSKSEETKEEKAETFTRKEYNFSSFTRNFTLPEDVKQEKIDARYADGVLRLVLPKKDEAKKMNISKSIEIK